MGGTRQCLLGIPAVPCVRFLVCWGGGCGGGGGGVGGWVGVWGAEGCSVYMMPN